MKKQKKLTKADKKRFTDWFASKGGEARAKKLTPERRSEIASIAGSARWSKASAVPTT